MNGSEAAILWQSLRLGETYTKTGHKIFFLPSVIAVVQCTLLLESHSHAHHAPQQCTATSKRRRCPTPGSKQQQQEEEEEEEATQQYHWK